MGVNYNPKIVTDGLVLALDAANSKSYPGTGTTWADLSGNANNGTLVNGVGYDGDNQGGMVFDGINDFVQGSVPFSGNQESFSFSLWARAFSRSSSYDGVFQLDGNGTGDYLGGIIISFYVGDTTLRIRYWNDGGTNHTWTNTDFINGIWHNFVVVVAGKTIKVYENNIIKVNTSFTNDWDLEGGYRVAEYTAGGFLDGEVSNVHIYDRPLTESEIKQNFNATRSRYGV